MCLLVPFPKKKPGNLSYGHEEEIPKLFFKRHLRHESGLAEHAILIG
jgi:hypothetical protein